MRISTASRHDETIASLQHRQQDLAQTQSLMTTGKRIARASDDPTGAARAERAFIAQQRIGSEQRSVAASRSAMTLAEATLGQSAEMLQQARETVVAVGNGSYTAAERSAQVAQLRSLRGQLLGLANRDDGGGGHVFGGQSAASMPFQDGPAGVMATAAGGQSQLSGREAMPATFDGRAVWLSARSGNGVFDTTASGANRGQAWISPGSVSDPSALTGSSYALVFSLNAGGAAQYTVVEDGAPGASAPVAYMPGSAITVHGMSFTISGSPADGDRFGLRPSSATLDPFSALDRAITALSDPQAGGGQVAQAVAFGMRDLDAVLSHLQAARSDAGSALNRLDTIDQRNQDSALAARAVQADAEDADMVRAVSDFQNKQTGYQAALQSYAMVQRMSLLDFLK